MPKSLQLTSATPAQNINSSDSSYDAEAGVGLSDPVQSESRRKLLDLVNRLHSTGVQLDVDLPMIAVIGSQSAGKSSLIESISGITLPRASGTCTRCPTECRLSFSNEPWKCTVELRFTIDSSGQPLGTPIVIPFGALITSKSAVEERLRRAQRAVLNPNTTPEHFLNGHDEDPTKNELSFSTNCVSLQISGRDLTDLSFCDLPGLIASVSKGGSASDINLVQNLVTSYISKPSCLVLLTVACETDFENQGAHHLAKTYDPEGRRTIGVLTKPDRIPAGEEDRWLRFIRNDAEPLENGWFAVKQPNSQALATGISWQEAREQENTFFSSTSPWSISDGSYRRRFGTGNLTERLSVILSDLIRRRLPELQQELHNLYSNTRNSLRELPDAPTKDSMSEVIHLVATFTRDLSRHIEGTPDENGIIQSISPLQEKFRMAIRGTAPNFRPYKQKKGAEKENEAEFSHPSFLSNEEIIPEAWSNTKAIFIEEVMDRAIKAKTRELPDNYPFVVSKMFIRDVTDRWNGPAHDLLEQVSLVLAKFVKKVIETHFGRYPKLYQKVVSIFNEVSERCYESAREKIEWYLRVEQGAFTLNEHYYSDYKSKFLAFYRGSLLKGSNASLIKRLESAGKAPQIDESAAKALSGIAELGMHGVKLMDLPKLLPPNPYEPALQIMAGVRAYFQVAYKRFSDNVPMAVDHELVRGLDWDRGIEQALLSGLGVSGLSGPQRCKDLLEEPHNISARRDDLTKKLERLETAKRQLLDLF